MRPESPSIGVPFAIGFIVLHYVLAAISFPLALGHIEGIAAGFILALFQISSPLLFLFGASRYGAKPVILLLGLAGSMPWVLYGVGAILLGNPEAEGADMLRYATTSGVVTAVIFLALQMMQLARWRRVSDG